MKSMSEPETAEFVSRPGDTDPAAAEPTRRSNPLDSPGWDKLVLSHPDACFFHGSAWARVLQESYGYRPFYFATFDDHRLMTLLPTMEVNSWLTGRRGVSLPFTDSCPPLVSFATAPGSLFDQVIACGRARGWRYWQGRSARKLFSWAPASLAFYGHTLNLSVGEDQLFANLHSSVRRAIRKARKDGVQVELSRSLEALKAYYALHCLTRQRQGLPPQPFRFFESLHRHVLSANLGQVSLARCGGKAIAGAVFFHFGRQTIYKYAASDMAFQSARGANLVLWEAIRWYASQGSWQLDLGRTERANDGLRRFKLGWGTEEHLIEFIRYDLRKRRFVLENDVTLGWHNGAFSRLPLSLSRIIGACLYRHCA